MTSNRVTPAILLLSTLSVAAAFVLGSCATSPSSLLTLADSKAPAQLLRNDAASRIPDDAIARIDEAVDVSIACLSEAEDPERRNRAWKSAVELILSAESAAKVDELVDELVESYLDQGWTDRSLGGTTIDRSRFISGPSSTAILRVTGKRIGVDDLAVTDEGATGERGIRIEVRGPCVNTDGPESDEVQDLEETG